MEKPATAVAFVRRLVIRGLLPWFTEKRNPIRDDYCDGLGDCLPACPVDAIRMIEREARL